MKLHGLPLFLRKAPPPPVTRRVVFVPNRRYTVDALATAIPGLQEADISYGFCLEKHRPDYESARSSIEQLNEIPFSLRELRETAGKGDVWVFSLDGSARRRTAIKALRARGVTTLGVQEGCRPSYSNRYRFVDEVLVWGSYAAGMFEGRSTIVGSPRLEELSRQARRASGGTHRDVAVINFKHPSADGYESRVRNWLGAALDAIARSGMRPLVSKHYYSADVPGHVDVYEGPIEDALLQSGVLISRPSTTVFEAMILGRQPFVFPLEDDALCEFHDPRGAFPVCWNAEQLSAALRDHMAGKSSYRHSEFLDGIVDIRPEHAAGDRMAEAILARLS